jgi:hypothetical protein
MAMHIFKESLPGAAASIAYLAMYDNNPRIRLEAAKYVVDRNLGRISDAAALLGGKEKPEWEKLVSNSIGAYVPDDPATH